MKTQIKGFTALLCLLSMSFGSSPTFSADASLVDRAKEERKLVAYLVINAADSVVVQTSFGKKFPQIKLEIVRAGAPPLLQRILTEYRGGKVFADVVVGTGFVLSELARQKLLTKFDSPERKAYIPKFKDKEGHWTNVYTIVGTIAYNTRMVPTADLPVRYSDLLLPKWKGKMGMNRSKPMFLPSMIDLYGKDKGMDFLNKLSAQNPQVRVGGTLLATLVAAGEFPIAFTINENSVEGIKHKGGPIEWVRLADPLYAENVPVGIMAGAANPNAARLFADYLLSKEGQELFRDLGKIPARSDVASKLNIDLDKLRLVSAEEEARSAYYAKLFEDLFVK